ncbi:proton-coupled zinc antiporter SLC30A1-like isoform X2 [Amphiura filiformis]|uniref:proton-coupled zinc antiporter SLC30A1-like isoform X2 n=1 Tax=Amphiura filiformis TaxID=82378 RepID=UPI003B2150DB
MGRFSGKTCRLLTMMALTTTFFFVEIITGYATGSVALIADSFHMLSDIISLIVGFAAIKISKKTTSKNTFGWQRAEVLGALVNAVFLMALCFTIVVESVQRFIEIEEIDKPMLVLIVGGVGLLINGIGLCLLSTHGLGHGHSHGGSSSHGHSHGANKKKTADNHPKMSQDSTSAGDFNYAKVPQGDQEVSYQQPNGFSYAQIEDTTTPTPNQNQNSESVYTSAQATTATEVEESGVQLAIDVPPSDVKERSGSVEDASGQLNMRGVFLHVLGDFLGSVVVIISALFIWLAPDAWDWKYYMDPAMSLIIVLIITTTTIPLFKQSSMILMNSIPTDVDIEDIEDRLKQMVRGIENIHDFHVWQLSGNKIIATAHIRFCNIHDYMQGAKEIKDFLHDEGIHSTTIQPEFSEDMATKEIGTNCMLMCQEDCQTKTCCNNENQTRRRKSADANKRKSQTQETSPSHQNSSLWSRALDLARATLQKPETAMGTTVVKLPPSSAEDSV